MGNCGSTVIVNGDWEHRLCWLDDTLPSWKKEPAAVEDKPPKSPMLDSMRKEFSGMEEEDRRLSGLHQQDNMTASTSISSINSVTRNYSRKKHQPSREDDYIVHAPPVYSVSATTPPPAVYTPTATAPPPAMYTPSSARESLGMLRGSGVSVSRQNLIEMSEANKGLPAVI